MATQDRLHLWPHRDRFEVSLREHDGLRTVLSPPLSRDRADRAWEIAARALENGVCIDGVRARLAEEGV